RICRSDTCHLAKDLQSARKRSVIHGKRNSEMRVAATENAAGDDQYVALDRLGDELEAGTPRRAGEGVERPFRPRQVVEALQRRNNGIALAVIGVDVASHALVGSDDPGVLHDARGADEAE